MTSKYTWRKSSYSDPQANCVEAAHGDNEIVIRDSKNPAGPALVITPAVWQGFTASIKAGRTT